MTLFILLLPTLPALIPPHRRRVKVIPILGNSNGIIASARLLFDFFCKKTKMERSLESSLKEYLARDE